MRYPRLTFVLALLLLLPVAAAVAQKPVITNAEVRAVNVYRRGVELRSQATCSVPAGITEVVIRNVARQFQEESLQVGLNSESATILSSEYLSDLYRYYQTELANPETTAIYTKIRSLENEIRTKQNEQAGCQNTLKMLELNQRVPNGNQSYSVEQMNQYTDFYLRKQTEFRERSSLIDSTIAKLGREIRSLRYSLMDSNEGEERLADRNAILLRVQSDKPAQLRLSIRYLSPNAGWSPQYEIKGKDISSPLQLTARAMLNQSTGIRWKDVELTLTNGYPNDTQMAPKPEPWFLHTMYASEKNVLLGYGMKKSSITMRGIASAEAYTNRDLELSDDSVGDNDYDGEATEDANFTVETNLLNVSYEVKTKYDIRSNGQNNIIPLYKQEIPAEFTYYTMPTMVPEAYLMAKVRDYSKYGLLSAPANVIFDNTFVGRTQINPSSTGETLEVTLGRDPRIAVDRKTVADKSGEKFLSSSREKTITYDIVVKNNKREAIRIGIKDRIPLSTDESIKVELLEKSGAWYDTDHGYLAWDVSLEPGESQSLRVSYRVRYPKALSIINL